MRSEPRAEVLFHSHMERLQRRSGIGLRTPHYRDFLALKPDIGFFEVHSENFFGRNERGIGGQPRSMLEKVRADYPLSLHGIGLSLGSAQPVNREHLRQLKMLAERFEPLFISDHLAWVGIDGLYLNDLLPLPYTEESLAVMVGNVLRTQDFLGRSLLIENPSCYLQFSHSTIPEWEFLNTLAQRTGCGILLDVNNIYVSAANLKFDPLVYLSGIDVSSVREFHLAGFTREGNLLIDTHSRSVADEVWSLYALALNRFGDMPTLIEWDADLPQLSVLLNESNKADRLRAQVLSEKRINAVAL